MSFIYKYSSNLLNIFPKYEHIFPWSALKGHMRFTIPLRTAVSETK